MIKRLTPKEYADLRGITLQAVTKVLRADKKPPGVTSIENHGRFYLLKVRLTADGKLLIKEAAAKEKIKLPKG